MMYAVTGSAGYIGRACFQQLAFRNELTVVGIDRKPGSTTGIVSDLSLDCPGSLDPEVIFHLAGLYEKDFNRRDHITRGAYEHDNVFAVEKVLDWAASCDSHLVFASSMLASESPLATDLYTRTKVEADDLVQKRTDVSSAVLRLPRVIGVSRYADPNPAGEVSLDIVSMMARQLLSEGKIEIRGGSLLRWYIHIDDAVQCITSSTAAVGVYDARLYDAISIRDIARIVRDVGCEHGAAGTIRESGGQPLGGKVDDSIPTLRDRVNPRFESAEELISNVADSYFKIIKNS